MQRRGGRVRQELETNPPTKVETLASGVRGEQKHLILKKHSKKGWSTGHQKALKTEALGSYNSPRTSTNRRGKTLTDMCTQKFPTAKDERRSVSRNEEVSKQTKGRRWKAASEQPSDKRHT